MQNDAVKPGRTGSGQTHAGIVAKTGGHAISRGDEPRGRGFCGLFTAVVDEDGGGVCEDVVGVEGLDGEVVAGAVSGDGGRGYDGGWLAGAGGECIPDEEVDGVGPGVWRVLS